MSSLTNFLLSIFVARSLGAAQFGAFSLAYVTYGLAINASRGLSIEPLLIRFSGTAPPTWRRATALSTGTALLVGLILGACALGAGRIVSGTTGLAFVALGLTLPGLMLQDSWRYAFFARGHGHHAFINDTVWALVLLPALVLLRITGHMNVFWFVLAWGAAANVAAVIAPLQARVVPNLAGATKWLSRHRDLGPRYLLENTGGNLSVTLRTFSVASILTLAAVGYMQAANTLMGPFVIILAGVSLITLPEAAKLMRRSPRHLPIFCAASSAVLSLLAGVWGAVLLVGLPRGLGQLMLGQPMAADLSAGAAGHTRDDGQLPHERSAPGPARPGRRAAEPALRAPQRDARRNLRRRRSPDRRHARLDAFHRDRLADQHADVLVAVPVRDARVGQGPGTQVAVAGPPGRR